MEMESLSEGLRLHRAGQYDEAECLYRAALDDDPEHPDAMYLLGCLLIQTKRFDAAIECLKVVIDLAPDHLLAHNNLGLAYLASANAGAAFEQFEFLVANEPDNWGYHYRLAACARELNRLDVALKHMDFAFKLNPLAPDAHEFIVAAQLGLGLFVSAACFAEKWARLPGQHDRAMVSLAESLANGRIFATANQLLGRVLTDDLRLWNVRAYVAHQQQDLEQAKFYFEKALETNPNDARILTNKGVVELALGEMQAGWQNFSARYRPGGPMFHLRVDAPEWDGRKLDGETVLVHSEQGFGDVIQFMRFFPKIEAQGGRILFTSYPDVIGLLSTQQGAFSHSDPSKIDLSYQWQIPLMNLGGLYANKLEELPVAPYVSANEERVRIWRDRLGEKTGVRIGLVWSGNPKHGNDLNRSAALDDFEVLGDVPGVTFFSLQKGETAGQVFSPPAGMNLVNLSADIQDFADTAAIISELDLVICVDTSVAHLAGAMGRPVWVLLPSVVDWRWLEEREDSPWYPSMRLFRLGGMECWTDLMSRVRTEVIEVSRKQTIESHAVSWAAFDFLANGQGLDALKLLMADQLPLPWGLLKSLAANSVLTYEQAKELLDGMPFDLSLLQLAHGDILEVHAIEFILESGDPVLACNAMRTLASVLSIKGAWSELQQLANEGIKRFPWCAEFVYWRGQAYRISGQWGLAAADYQEFLKVAPRNPKAMVNLSCCLRMMGQADESLAVIQRAVLMNQTNEMVWRFLMGMLAERNLNFVLRLVCDHMIQLFPSSAQAFLQRSIVYGKYDQVELAKESLDRALEISPDLADRDYYRAYIYAVAADWDNAIPLFEQIVRDAPSNFGASMWLAQHYLRNSNWKKGWAEWEKRLNDGRTDCLSRALPELAAPRWDGTPLNGRTLLVLCDQGFGDTLNFLHLLNHIVGDVILVVQDGLVSLCSALGLPCQVMSRTSARQTAPVCDVAVELLSLPYFLGLGDLVFPPDRPYLEPNLDGHPLSDALSSLSGLKVGLVWAGNPSHGDTRFRDCPFGEMAKLIEIEGIAWCSFQKEDAADDVLFAPAVASRLNNIAPSLNNWLDTAAVLAKMDLLITVDTAIAHLAGAMGRPVWLLLSKRSDWRWGNFSGTSLWYPSLRVFRQQKLDDWSQVIHQVAEELQCKLRENTNG